MIGNTAVSAPDKPSVFGRRTAFPVLENVSEIIAARKSAAVGNFTDGKLCFVKQLFGSLYAGLSEVFLETEPGKLFEFL